MLLISETSIEFQIIIPIIENKINVFLLNLVFPAIIEIKNLST